MNRLTATVTEIRNSDMLHMITLEAGHMSWKVQTLQLNSSVHPGKTLQLSFNSNDIIVSAPDAVVGVANTLSGHVQRIDEGKLLNRLFIETPCGSFEAIISHDAYEKIGSPREVALHIPQNIISLSEVQ